MGALNKRLEALEADQGTKTGHTVVYNTEKRPGHYWRPVEGVPYYGEDPAPEGVETFNQDQVDAMGKTGTVIIVQYVEKWRDGVQP